MWFKLLFKQILWANGIERPQENMFTALKQHDTRFKHKFIMIGNISFCFSLNYFQMLKIEKKEQNNHNPHILINQVLLSNKEKI